MNYNSVSLQSYKNFYLLFFLFFGIANNSSYLCIFFIFCRYYLQFEARKGYSSRGDTAIDDISISPKCFGIGE